MQSPGFRRVLVWDGWIRLTHWLIAFGLAFELAGAWLIDNAAVDTAFWRDWHVMTGHAILLALLFRFALMLRGGSSHIRALLPRKGQCAAMGQMLRFYLSLGRTPLPRWYAHNPLWGPLYLAMFLILLIVAASGLLLDASFQSAGARLHELHGSYARFLGWLAAAHVLAVMLHDWKGDGADISGMLSGHRYFQPQRSVVDSTTAPQIEVSLDQLTGRRAPPR